jgi:hypothetical protein
MLRSFIDPTFILVLFVLVRSSDIGIAAIMARDYLRIAFYGLVALLALIWVLLKLLGL